MKGITIIFMALIVIVLAVTVSYAAVVEGDKSAPLESVVAADKPADDLETAQQFFIGFGGGGYGRGYGRGYGGYGRGWGGGYGRRFGGYGGYGGGYGGYGGGYGWGK